MKQPNTGIISATALRVRHQLQELTGSVDLLMSRFVDISQCESVCLALGPYRNLTTLTAATIFLHPNCQVLNHAGVRIYGHRQVDFLSDYSSERFNRFIQYAIKISTTGKSGKYGGTITISHAFGSEHTMKEVYSRTGEGLLKENIKCLFWKESLRTSNVIRDRNVDLGRIFESDKRLRFLMPIRNPMDCASSNLKTVHVHMFRNLHDKSSVIEIAKAVLDEILWFADLQERYPSRFFYYFEHAISREMLINLAKFLGVDPDETWLNNALAAMKVTGGYNHSSDLQTFYQQYVTDKFERFPSLSQGLMQFLERENKVTAKPDA